ncbi:hypothetical protein BH10CHL1_BH10CHL1_18470 [soil metagenome]
MKMNIPLNATVYTQDGQIGRSACIIVNPINQTITHFVLQRNDLFGYQELVPVALIKETTLDMILLNCSTHDLADLASFTKSEFMGFNGSTPDFAADSLGHEIFAWPYSPYAGPYNMTVTVEQVPHDELGIHRGAHVDATDGRVGQVDEFLVNPANFHITHLVLREGHLWGKKEVTIPVSAIESLKDDSVHLKLSKAELLALPHVPVHR